MDANEVKHELLDWLYNSYSQAIQVDRTPRKHELLLGDLLESLFEEIKIKEDICNLYECLTSLSDFLLDIRDEHLGDYWPDFE